MGDPLEDLTFGVDGDDEIAALALPVFAKLEDPNDGYERDLPHGQFELFVVGAKAATADQRAAVAFLRANELPILNAILDGLCEYFDRLRDAYELADYPSPLTPDHLRAHLDLTGIDIEPHGEDGVAYSFFRFGCDFDPEHGIEVAMHRDRFLEAGQQYETETRFEEDDEDD